MVAQAIERLEYLTKIIPPLLAEIKEADFSAKPLPNKWSKKEIIGHLIDSATNNHQRFVRGQFEDIPAIRYDQNKWNEFSFYQQRDSQQLISFWKIYNEQLVEIMKRISNENLMKKIKIVESEFTLEFIINDYVVHLEHHLKQVIKY